MAINGTSKFFRCKRDGILCSICGVRIRKDRSRGGSTDSWIAWNRQRGELSKSWHWDCDRPNEVPPYEYQFHKADFATGGNFDNPVNNDATTRVNGVGETVPVIQPTAIEKVTENGGAVVVLDEVDTQPVPENAPTSNGDATSGLLKTLADLLLPHIDGRINSKTAGFEKLIADAVADAIAKATPVTRVEIVKPDGKSVVMDGVHKQFPQLLGLVSIRQWAFLHGAPGGFKTTTAAKVAEALGLPFESIQLCKTTTASELKGYKDGNGVYQSSGFRRCYENGGVFLIDEIDNAMGNLLTVLNSALSNGHYGFPDRMVQRHPDFVCIATGNTAGRGASKGHEERVKMDAATLERFKSVPWVHDWDLTKQITLAINPQAGFWFDWVRKTHDFCTARYQHVTCSPRAAMDGAEILKLGKLFSIAEIAEMTVYKGVDADTVRAIESASPLPIAA